MNSDLFDIAKEAALVKAKLPSLPMRPRKNLFDILKIQHREIRNSNILAYFFDPNEEHGFGFLFYYALQEIAVEKVKLQKEKHPAARFKDISSFGEVKEVKTEEQTTGAKLKTKSIDIVLEGEDWVIGIENKLHHHLNNPLNIYWAHLKSKNKIPFGILLTLFPLKLKNGKLDDGNYFLNVTHRELMERVRQNIQLTEEVDNTDIVYLQEYFKNIESHYYHLKNKPEMNTLIQEITENYNSIMEIVNKKDAAENYLDEQINIVFSEYGYIKIGKWYRREDKKFDLYFYIRPASELMRQNELGLSFEVRNETNHNVNKHEFKQHFTNQFNDLKGFCQSDLVTSRDKTHAFIYREDKFFQKERPFNEKIKEVLHRLIGKQNSPVKQVEEYLQKRNQYFTG